MRDQLSPELDQLASNGGDRAELGWIFFKDKAGPGLAGWRFPLT